MGAGKIVVVLVLGTLACRSDGGAGQLAARDCRVLQRPSPLPAELRETSGVARSRRDPETLWTLNDSGEPDVFAVDASGRARGRVRVTGAKLNDWEDVALGPCPAGSCLYLGDLGDNDAKRKDVEVYRVPEPNPGDSETAEVERLRVRYPGGPRDAEALFVLPSGEVWIVSKGRDHPATLFRYPGPLRPDETVELERVRDLSTGPVPRDDQITGADATPNGEWVALRTYTSLLLYRTQDLLGSGAPALRVDLRPLGEAQGEAVTINADGTVVLTSEAGEKGLSPTVSRLQCVLPGRNPSPS